MAATNPEVAPADFMSAFINAVFFGPEQSRQAVDSVVSQFVTDDYVQIGNGEVLDRQAFLAHVMHLKSIIASGSATVVEAIAAEGKLADRHLIHATKHDGSEVKAEVILFADICSDGRLSSVRELTRLISGSPEDASLGTATG